MAYVSERRKRFISSDAKTEEKVQVKPKSGEYVSSRRQQILNPSVIKPIAAKKETIAPVKQEQKPKLSNKLQEIVDGRFNSPLKTAEQKQLEQNNFTSQKNLNGALNFLPKQTERIYKVPAPISFATGLADTATLGLLETQANRNTNPKGLPKLDSGKPSVKDFLDTAKSQNPKSYMGGQMAGYLVPGMGIERGATSLLNPLLKGTSGLVGKLATGAVTGGAQELIEGSIRGFGDGNINVQDFKDIGKRTAQGTVLGAFGDAALYGVGKGINKIIGNKFTPKVSEIANSADTSVEPLNDVLSQSNKSNIITPPMAEELTQAPINSSRRLNDTLREKISKMNPDEQYNALYNNPLTGIMNKRAYSEILSNPQIKKPIQVSSDVDALKYFNDNLGGHSAGDALLKAMSDSLSETGHSDIFHISGDEFAAQFDNIEEANRVMQQAQEVFKNKTIKITMPDGTVTKIKGGGFSYGIGETPEIADQAMLANKSVRERQGLRPQRGERPPNLIQSVEEIQPKGLENRNIGRSGQQLSNTEGLASASPFNLPKTAAANIDNVSSLNVPVEKVKPISSGLKSELPKSKFAQTVADSKNTVPQVAEDLKKLDLGYDVATNAKSLEQANARIATDTEAAVRFVMDNKAPSAEHTTTAIQLINKFQKEGNYERAVDIATDISKKLTKNGQAIQAASIYDRLSPEGILMYAQRQVNKLNDDRWFKGLTKEQKIDPNLAKQLQELSKKMQGLTGDAKIEASQELQQALQALGKSTLGRKIESAQTIGQLLNPKTIVRNTIGNELFYRLERFNKYVATPIDIARSKITGTERTITFKTAGQSGYWNGFFKGAKAGWKGVNPGGLQTQFDLTAPAFKNKWNPLRYMEKTLGATLKGFDYAAYTRAVNQTIGEMAELKAINLGMKGNKLAVAEFVKNTEKNILDIADQYGKYVTFQDDNVLSKGLSAVKRGLNVGKDFGVGSLIIKYPKTPGSLIMRGLDYSAAGFLKSAYEIAKPLFKGGKIDQQAATMALSRAITGTLGFTGLGYYLADNGVITGRTDKDSDVREIQKQTGAGSYKVNLSALQRWALGGFHTADLNLKDNDMLYSYDWMSPISMAISFGANINTNLKESEGAFDNLGATVASSLEGALGTIAEQPVLQGLTRQFQGYDLGQNVTQTLKGIPSSFTPTALNQIRQLKDNTGRSTYSPSPLKSALNMAQVKIPGKSEQLPANYDTLGKQKENYQNGSNNIFNVMFNPGFVSRNKPTPVQKEILRLYETTGNKTQFPRVISSKITYTVKGDSNSYTFTQEEKPLYQKAVGELVQSGIERLMLNPSYKLATDAEKVKKVYNVLNDSSEKAKNDFLKRKGLK